MLSNDKSYFIRTGESIFVIFLEELYELYITNS